jgi:hypothetical protein
MSNQIPDKDFVYNALLRYNYLPIGKKNPDDIPFPAFSTEDFTPDIANEMLGNYARKRQGKEKVNGYDQIEYRTTRFNLVTRLMHIPHPSPYARLCKCLSENWDELSHICENSNSREKLGKHDKGRRIMGKYENLEQISVMNYSKLSDARFRLKISTGKFYRVKADISSFYPSIYTHSIPWAVVGRDDAKINSNEQLWYNELDEAQRDVRRNETQGIPIGPATSHIISEFILSKVDEALGDYTFVRYIDDYECYCENREDAEDFILKLEQELRNYLLSLNPKKVMVEELPLSYQEQWTAVLRNNLPSKHQPPPRDIMSFLDLAVDLQKHYPEGSVLKYATRTLANSKKFNKNSADFFLKYLIALAVHRPSVLPILCQVAKENDVGSDLDITPVLKQSIKFQRSDAICWGLYFMGIGGQKVRDDLAEKIIGTADCMSMAMLIALKQHKEKVVDFLTTITPDSYYHCDRYWILIHELVSDCPQFKRYRGDSGLKFLIEKKVRFVKSIESKN